MSNMKKKKKKKTIEREVTYNGIEFTADNYGKVKIDGQLQKQSLLAGYKYLSCNGLLIPVHRIIAKAFCENPMSLSEADHINSIKTDNRASNLRWTSRLENNRRLHKRRAASKNFKRTSHRDEVLKVVELKTGKAFFGSTWNEAAEKAGRTRQALIVAWNKMNAGEKKHCKWSIQWIKISALSSSDLKAVKKQTREHAKQLASSARLKHEKKKKEAQHDDE